MKKIIARLKREPILTRAGLAAVLNVLVVSGVIDTGISDAVQVAVIDVAAVVLALTGRAKVTPVDVITEAVEATPGLYVDGKAVAEAIAHARRHAAK